MLLKRAQSLTLRPSILDYDSAYRLQGKHQVTHSQESGHLPVASGTCGAGGHQVPWRKPALSGEAGQSNLSVLSVKSSMTLPAFNLQRLEPDVHITNASRHRTFL